MEKGKNDVYGKGKKLCLWKKKKIMAIVRCMSMAR